MEEYPILKNEEDWYWYKVDLDLKARYKHRHYGEPKRYPCRVKSAWDCPPCEPYTYTHYFSYQEERTVICPVCGHKETVKFWSDFEED